MLVNFSGYLFAIFLIFLQSLMDVSSIHWDIVKLTHDKNTVTLNADHK